MTNKIYALIFFSFVIDILYFLSGLKDEQMMVFNQAISYLLSLFERWNFDLIYLAWLWSLFKPLCILLLSLFLLPAVILIFMYGSSLFCLIYKHWNRLKVGKILFFIDRKIKAISICSRLLIQKIFGMERLKH